MNKKYDTFLFFMTFEKIEKILPVSQKKINKINGKYVPLR